MTYQRKKYAIFDLDGVLCNIDHRLQLAQQAQAFKHQSKERSDAWEMFHAACVDDEPYPEMVTLARVWAEDIHLDDRADNDKRGILYITGRTITQYDKTAIWFEQQGLPYGALYMRPAGDSTPASGFKKRVYEQEILPMLGPEDEITFVVEDNTHVVAMWRAQGLTCLQPRKG